VTDALAAASWDGDRVLDPGPAATNSAEDSRAWTADDAVSLMFAAHYRSLVRLAVLLMHDAAAAEDVTQDAYVALHSHWRRLRDADKALAYLRATVLNRARSALRRRSVVTRYLAAAPPPGTEPSAEAGALELVEHAAVLAVIRRLPVRQREAIVLRYYADLSEAQIADAMGISRGAVKSHTARGMAALREKLRSEGAA
jgi:RNA polymerase sigma-70 factor (sigma-E family)